MSIRCRNDGGRGEQKWTLKKSWPCWSFRVYQERPQKGTGISQGIRRATKQGDWWLWTTHFIIWIQAQSQMDWCSLGNENRSNLERTFSHEEYLKWACGTKCQRQGGPGMCKSMLGSVRHRSGMGWEGRGTTRDTCAVELFHGCTETLWRPNHTICYTSGLQCSHIQFSLAAARQRAAKFKLLLLNTISITALILYCILKNSFAPFMKSKAFKMLPFLGNNRMDLFSYYSFSTF